MNGCKNIITIHRVKNYLVMCINKYTDQQNKQFGLFVINEFTKLNEYRDRLKSVHQVLRILLLLLLIISAPACLQHSRNLVY